MLRRLAGSVLIMLAVLVGSSVTAHAGANPDITGIWDTEVQLLFGREAPEGQAACIWQGLIVLDMTANPGPFDGSGDLGLTFGSKCPPSLEGDVDGSIDGLDLLFGFAGSDLGAIEFDGMVDPDGNSMSGTWSQIPDGGVGGTWTAVRVGGVPALDTWGVIALMGLLLSISFLVLRRARV